MNQPKATFNAGPSQVWDLIDYSVGDMSSWRMESHRSDRTKELLKGMNRQVFDILGIPEELRDAEFTDFSETPDGWHVGYTNSGTDGMERAIRGLVGADHSTVLVDNDNFSKVARKEMEAFGRKYEAIELDRGQGIEVDSKRFEKLASLLKGPGLRALYLTLNATTTGVEQRDAIEELVKIRNQNTDNHHGTGPVIIVDAVSAQLFGRDWDPEALPDCMFWAHQKDAGIGPGTGHIVFNNRALARTIENREMGLDTGGKLGIEGIYGTNKKRMTKNGQTAQTPPLQEIYVADEVYHYVLEGDNRSKMAEQQMKAAEEVRLAIEGGGLGDLGYDFLTQNPDLRSRTTHVLTLPEGLSGPALAEALRTDVSYPISMATGYGAHKNSEMRFCVYSANDLEQVRMGISKLIQHSKSLLAK